MLLPSAATTFGRFKLGRPIETSLVFQVPFWCEHVRGFFKLSPSYARRLIAFIYLSSNCATHISHDFESKRKRERDCSDFWQSPLISSPNKYYLQLTKHKQRISTQYLHIRTRHKSSKLLKTKFCFFFIILKVILSLFSLNSHICIIIVLLFLWITAILFLIIFLIIFIFYINSFFFSDLFTFISKSIISKIVFKPFFLKVF